MGTIFTAVLLLFVAISVVWSVFVRKLIKTRIRSISVIVCVVLALVGTVAIKDFVLNPNFVSETLLPALGSILPAEVAELINASTVLLQTAIGLPVALLSPVIFIVLYALLSILAGIIYLFVLLFAGRKLRRSKKNRVPYSKVRGIIWSAASAVLALVVILLPVAFYGELLDDAIDAVVEAEILDAEMNVMLENVSDQVIVPLNESTAVQMFRAFGGDGLIDDLSSFTVDGDSVSLKDEFSAIVNLVGDIMPLTQAGEPQNYGEKEADCLVAIADSFSNSKFLTVVASEAVYFLTEDMVNSDEPIIEDETGMFNGLLDRMIVIIHDDAKDPDQFAANVKTVAEMAGVLIKDGVLSSMDDTDALLDELAGGTTIKDMIIVLGKNSSMKYLIPEVTNIGIKAIASAVEVKADAGEAYEDLMNTIAADLNSVKELDDDAAKVAELSPKLNSAFDHAGIVVDKQVIDLYSGAMIDGILCEVEGDVTPADVKAFFIVYAWSAEAFANGSAETPDLSGTIYDGLTVDALKQTSPAALARVIERIVAINAENGPVSEQAENILAEEGNAILNGGEGSALYDMMLNVKIKKAINAGTSANTASLQSVEAFEKTSLLIFMDELVVDIDDAAKEITDATVENEAEAIGGIFSEAGSLMDDVSGDEIDIGSMAQTVGAILNSLQTSKCVGEERTAKLFIAIIQSGMVRDAAGMDIATATDLGLKGTQKNADGTPVDFEKTFKIISSTMDVLENMNSSTAAGMTQEDLSNVLKDLTPQTAGMMETFITEERLTEDYGVSEEFSGTAAPLISDVFGYMGSADMTEEECAEEAEALNDVMNLVTSASDKANSGETSETVFGGENSVLGKSAEDTVSTFMSSESIKHSLNNNSGDLEEDPFGMGDMMVNDGETNEKKDLEDAMKNYYETTEYETEEEKAADRETLTNLGKLFGFTSDEMDYILGE